MNVKSIALLASAMIAAGATVAQNKPDQGCGAGACSKKVSKPSGGVQPVSADAPKDAACSKKDGGCSKKEAGCSKK